MQENGDQENSKPLASLSLIRYKDFENCQKGKLLVLDLDKTLCDFGPVHVAEMTYEDRMNHSISRPYLYYFMRAVHEYYDIAIWSATSLNVIKLKLDALGLLDNENFKINFVLDKTHMVPLGKKCLCSCCSSKALRVIWEKYPMYNKTNTIIVDDLMNNFKFNPKNGLLIKPYRQSMHKVDVDLHHLAAYLVRLAKKICDFTEVEHSNYKNYNVMPQYWKMW